MIYCALQAIAFASGDQASWQVGNMTCKNVILMVEGSLRQLYSRTCSVE